VSKLTQIIYKPFAIIGGVIAGKLAQRLFSAIWARIDDREPPLPSHEDASLKKVVAAAVLEAGISRGTRVAVDRAGARGFANLTGIWPGGKAPERSE
jgi:hypothetical protein